MPPGGCLGQCPKAEQPSAAEADREVGGNWVLMHGQVQTDCQRAEAHRECNEH